MPHIWIEYSANLATDIDLAGLMREVQAAAIGDGSVFPLAGARTRAVRVDDYRIADGHPDNAFVHALLKVGHGRDPAELDALGQRSFAALRAALEPVLARRPLGLSLQVEEAHAVLNYKHSNYREHLARRAAAPRPRTVLGLLHNDRKALDALGDAVQAAPYGAAPRAPVLYVKPANTYAAPGARVALPADVPEVVVGVTLAIEFARPVSRATRASALDGVAGFRVVADLYAPHDSWYRPALRQKCRDGFCPIGAELAAPAAVGDTTGLGMQVRMDGALVFEGSTADCVRDVAQAIVDVSEFMTLEAGDLLLLGVPFGAPTARAGQHVEVEIERVGRLAFTLGAETGQPTLIETLPQAGAAGASGQSLRRRARVVHEGRVQHVTEAADARLRLPDGRLVDEAAVRWLPPVEPRTLFTLAINYADHARELAFKAPEAPLGFLKAANTVIGHRGRTVRPADAKFMHYECELAVVIGARARHVPRERAYEVVAGYTVANDYAIRDYLENWYRPNLRVKSRDTCTPLGPWFVPRDAVADPMNLNLRTLVNGRETQSGNTRDMVFDIPALIAYFSSFMTLEPGDVILTGTPDGVVNVDVGDEVITEIEGIGRLINTLVADQPA